MDEKELKELQPPENDVPEPEKEQPEDVAEVEVIEYGEC